MYRPPNYISITDSTWYGITGIVVAGCWYALLTSVVVGFLMLVSNPWPYSISEILGGMMGVVLSVCVGAIVAAVAGLVGTGVVSIFNWSLGYPWHPVTAAGLAGGMAGFLATCVLPVAAMTNPPPGGFLVVVVLGNILGMVMGQVGAMRYSTNAICSHYGRQNANPERLFSESAEFGKVQFELKQLLVLTAWFGILFAALSALVAYSWIPLVLVAVYVGVQTVTHAICTFMMRDWVQRRLSSCLDPELVLKPGEIQYRDSQNIAGDPLAPETDLHPGEGERSTGIRFEDAG